MSKFEPDYNKMANWLYEFSFLDFITDAHRKKALKLFDKLQDNPDVTLWMECLRFSSKMKRKYKEGE